MESDAQTGIGGQKSHESQLLDGAAGAGEAVELAELELLSELAAGAVLSEGFDVSPPDAASLPPLADEGFAEE